MPLDDVVATATERARAALGLDARAHAQSKRRSRGPALDALAQAIQEDEDDFARWLAAIPK